MASSARVQGVDVARGLASAIMIQGHAYDGWVRVEEKTSASYLFTRVLGTLPLPSFLLLAGAAIALRIEAASARGEDPRVVRGALARRGLTVFAIGYAVNTAGALMDGYDGLATFFRADVLQVIGLSIVLLAWLGIGAREGRLDRRRLIGAGLSLAIVPIVICPLVSAALWDTPEPWSYAVGLVSMVSPITRMPLVPLTAWAAIGLLISLALIGANRDAKTIAGAPTRVLLVLFAVALGIAIAGTWLEGWMSAALGETLDQRSWAVIPNAIELAARGTVVLAVGALATPWLPRAVRDVLTRLGRGSLVAYVVHVPFCYGLLGRPIEGRLTMVEATGFVIALEVFSFAAVYVRDVLQARRAERSVA